MPLRLLYRFSVASAAVSAIFFSLPTQAQIVPDGTLGTQAIPFTPGACAGAGGDCGVTNGTTRGNNLFHSFQQFSLPNPMDRAGFVTAPTIQNVIVRVTGADISNINGTIATLDPAFNLTPRNFFLLNPNGIVFGPNAQIFVGGSFLASTAERMLFQDGTVFSARDQTSNPLLTVSVPVGLQFGQTSGAIQSRMRIAAGINSLFTDFALVGGDVMLDNSVIQVPGRRVELGSVAGAGTVGLNTTGNGLSLNFPDGLPRADISITNRSSVDVLGIDGGSLAVTAHNLDISGGSRLRLIAGIFSGLGFAGSQAGDITLNVTDIITVRQTSGIINLVQTGATGNAGNLLISTGSISVTEGSQLNASTFGTGNAGNVIINARDRVLLSDINTSVFSRVEAEGRGRGGNVQISAPNLEVLNGAQLLANTLGIGNAGSVIINARDRVLFSGNNSVAFSSVGDVNQQTIPQGNGGNVQISTGILEVLNGAQLLSSTFGIGNAGNVIINASDRVLFSGNRTGAVSTVGGVNQSTVPQGNGGNLQISTPSLEVLNGAQLLSGTLGIGDAGNVIINARDRVLFSGNAVVTSSVGGVNQSTVPQGKGGNIEISTGILEITNRSQLVSSTLGIGDAGSVIINARDRVLFSGNSDAASTVGGVNQPVIPQGNGGNVQISTPSLEVLNDSQLNASTFGIGNAGSVIINARDRVLFSGNNSVAFSRVGDVNQQTIPQGNGGNVQISTNTLEVTNGAAIVVNTLGIGDAGDVMINVRDRVLFNNGFVASSVGSVNQPTIPKGNGGNIEISTGILEVLNGSQLNASTFGTGNAGDVMIDARDQVSISGTSTDGQSRTGIFVSSQTFSGGAGNLTIATPQLRLDDRGLISAQSAIGDGGNITLNVRDLLLMRRGSQISTTAGSEQFGGNGGNITINAPNGFIVGVKGENSDISANAFTGSGGRVNITTQGIYGLQFRPRLTEFSDITASSTFGVSGVVAINTLSIDPSRGLQPLPVSLVDPSNRIDKKCAAGSGFRRSSFTVTGRGGLPENPLEPLQNSESVASWVEVGTDNPQPSSTQNISYGDATRTTLNTQNSKSPPPLIEADSLMVGKDGSVQLVASQSIGESGGSWGLPTCSLEKERDR